MRAPQYRGVFRSLRYQPRKWHIWRHEDGQNWRQELLLGAFSQMRCRADRFRSSWLQKSFRQEDVCICKLCQNHLCQAPRLSRSRCLAAALLWSRFAAQLVESCCFEELLQAHYGSTYSRMKVLLAENRDWAGYSSFLSASEFLGRSAVHFLGPFLGTYQIYYENEIEFLRVK